MVVKSKMVSEHVGDTGNIFEILRKHKLRLNASKYSFKVGSGTFLRYMVTYRGIEVNHNQIKAINSLQPPQNPKEVQKLTRMTATLNRFISQSGDRCRPFFLLMNKWKGFEWIEECALAFQQLKDYLSRPPIMSNPEMDAVQFAYIVVAPHAISLVLVQVNSDIQMLVYYVSKSLHKDFSATNNEAEYEALLMEMTMVQRIGGKAVEMFSDLRLVVGQVKKEFEARNGRMQGYLSQIKHLQSGFESFNLLQIPRSGNTHADSLATLATFLAQSLPQVILVEDLNKPTEVKREVVHVHQVRVRPSWMDSIVLFLKEDILPEGKSEADKNYSLRTYMKEFVEATLEVDLCRTEPLLKAIGGQTCKKQHRNM
ncbi:uncharacterized protein LOC136070809 [Quercus suber]|uniref:uncharacterized protein LOC136070809 n=1 Tax=Quercus suber TaxID=58331 RepID=UPI0032DF0511